MKNFKRQNCLPLPPIFSTPTPLYITTHLIDVTLTLPLLSSSKTKPTEKFLVVLDDDGNQVNQNYGHHDHNRAIVLISPSQNDVSPDNSNGN
jgi:hypothetical protein